jgi:hypothetical protein
MREQATLEEVVLDRERMTDVLGGDDENWPMPQVEAIGEFSHPLFQKVVRRDFNYAFVAGLSVQFQMP